MNKVKKFLPCLLCGALCIIGSAHAEVISSSSYTPSQMYSRCDKLINITKRDRCFACFFGGLCTGSNCSYRVDAEIQFDTSSNYNSCTEIEDDNVWEVFFAYEDCNQSWMATDPEDACQYCMWGGYSLQKQMIKPLDTGVGEIIFRALDNDVFECQVPDRQYVGCAPGWYGWASFDDAEQEWHSCYKCPGDGTTDLVVGEQTFITDCYIEQNKTFSDSTGKYTYSGKCYYTK